MAEVYGHKRHGVKSCFISRYLVTVTEAPLTLLSALALLLNDLGGVKVSPNICFLFHTFRIIGQQLIWTNHSTVERKNKLEMTTSLFNQ